MPEPVDTSTSSPATQTTGPVIQDDDGRTGFARLIGALLLIGPIFLLYPLISLWPRPQGSILCEWQKATQARVATPQGESPAQEREVRATSAPDQEEQPSSAETPSEGAPSTADAAATESTESTVTEAPAPLNAALVAREVRRLQDEEERREQWAPCATIRPFTGEFHLSADVRLLLLVLLAGALGAYVHAAQSYTSYIGNRKFRKQWTWWYLLRLPVGSALALFVYFTTRGGLLTGTTPPSETDDLNIFGIMSFAALAGLFSKQVIDKLAEVFSNFFKSEQDEQRGDKMVDKTASAQGGTTTLPAQAEGAAGAGGTGGGGTP